MRFEKKLAAALKLLASTGIWSLDYAPPLHRLLWRLGVEIPPPHFRGFAANFLFAGSVFGSAYGVMEWIGAWSPHLSHGIAGDAVGAGLLFGLFMGGYYRYGARRFRIPLWADFRPTDEDAFA